MENNKVSIFSSYKLFFKLILKDLKQFIILVILLILESSILVSSVITALPLVEYIVDPKLSDASFVTIKVSDILSYLKIQKSFTIFLLIFIFFNILKYLMTTIISVAILNIKYSLAYNLNEKLIKNIYFSEWKFFSDKNIGLIINSLTNIISRIVNGISEIALQLSFIFKIVSYLSIPLFLNWKLTLTAVLLVGIFTIPLKILNKYANFWGRKNTEFDNQLLKNISEGYQGAKLIFGFNLNKYTINKILKSLSNSISFAKKNLITQSIILNGFQPIALIGASITFFIFYKNPNNLPEIITIFYSLISAAPTLSSFLKGNFSITNLEPSLNQYNNISESAISERTTINQNKQKILNFKKEIKLENIEFYYNHKELVLENLNLCIKKNQFLVLKGHSGSGKSTVIDLILGLNRPTKGQIKIDGICINDLDIESYRNLLGYVPQDPFLFNGTIKDNILLNQTFSDNDINEALIKANCKSFIEDFPEKINTKVGDRGMNISGGQRQRICLARALIRKPKILILDEPTSSLDNESSNLIYDILSGLVNQMTIILVSHNYGLSDKNAIIKNLDNKNIK